MNERAFVQLGFSCLWNTTNLTIHNGKVNVGDRYHDMHQWGRAHSHQLDKFYCEIVVLHVGGYP